jgi:hypothetical protein
MATDMAHGHRRERFLDFAAAISAPASQSNIL